MREIREDLLIHASAGTVWRLLTDFAQFPLWNPFIREASGEVREGARLRVRIEPPGGWGMTFRPTVLRVVPRRELRWRGRLLVPGLFDGEHIFEIEPEEQGVRFVQREQFSGLLVPLLWSSLDTHTRQGFREMNVALKEKAEAAAG